MKIEQGASNYSTFPDRSTPTPGCLTYLLGETRFFTVMPPDDPHADAAPPQPASARPLQPIEDAPGPTNWLDKNPWATFVLPFAVFLAVGTLEPTPEHPTNLVIEIPYSAYPWVYTFKVALSIAAVFVVRRGYAQFPLSVSPLAFAVGAVGVVAWVGITHLQLEKRLLDPLGLGWMVDLGQRSAFNPFEQWPDNLAVAYAFLVVRFVGLALMVPVIEEFFLRGLVMRYFVSPDWWKVPFGTVNAAAILAGTLVPVAMHPAEMLAAAVWFSMVTWLMVRTRNIWDCVAAHATTNLLLGAWVVYSGQWYFL